MDPSECIIEEVKKYECLYNLGSNHNKNVCRKTEIWNEIGSVVNLSSDACRKRWRGLRDTYKRYKRAAQLDSGSGAPTPSKTWKYIKSLEFLNNYKDARPTIGSVEDDESDIDRVFDCVSCTVSEPTTNTDDSTADPIEIRTRKYTKKQTDEEVTSVFKDIMKECADTVKELASANEKDRDSTSVLFESLAKKIYEAKLKEQVVAEIEMKVMTLLYAEIAKNPSSI